jgi:putative peptide zinc metalloprotease protein
MPTTPQFPDSSTVALLPFTRQIEGEEAVIGRPEQAVFLAIPVEALEILDQLAAGSTVGEAKEAYLAKHGELPDLESLLAYLALRGFIGGSAAAPAGPPPLRFHFAGIPQAFARKLFSPPMQLAAGALILLAFALAVAEPALRPSWRLLFFDRHVTLMSILLMFAGLLLTVVHEMGHLTAARARGVGSRLGIGNRMWVLVAETDMSGIWALPSRQRFLPILAGPLTDAVSLSAIILVLFAHLRGWLALPPVVHQLLQAMSVLYLLNLLWQCYFFVRTDLYYVYTTAFGCKNLLGDTQDYLKNLLARLLHRPQPVDQQGIPGREMRAIRFYSGFYLVGRVLALAVFFLVFVPLIVQYGVSIAQRVFSSPEQQGTYQQLDALVFGTLSTGVLVAGIFLWCKEIYRNWRLQRVVATGDSPLRA